MIFERVAVALQLLGSKILDFFDEIHRRWAFCESYQMENLAIGETSQDAAYREMNSFVHAEV